MPGCLQRSSQTEQGEIDDEPLDLFSVAVTLVFRMIEVFAMAVAIRGLRAKIYVAASACW
jgi:hypothetical protein